MDGMEVSSGLKTQKPRIALRISVSKVTFFYHLVQTMSENIVVDAVGKQCHLC